MIFLVRDLLQNICSIQYRPNCEDYRVGVCLVQEGEHKEHNEEGEDAEQMTTKGQKEHKVQLFGHCKEEDPKASVGGQWLISGV